MNASTGRGLLAPFAVAARSRRLTMAAVPFALLVVLLAAVMAAGGRSAVGASSPAPTLPGGKIRTYYIAADTVAWNYAPAGRNMITGRRFGPLEDTYVKRGPARVGSMYLKSLYRRYTDGTFRQLAPILPQWRHLGFLGPAIQAEVGDTIVVHFKNNTPFATGMHPHGVRYAKDSEGALYNDGTSGKDKSDDAVPPGGDPHVHLAGSRTRRTRTR
jgi:hypothetical protein